MGVLPVKRARESHNGEDTSEAPIKRRRQANDADLKLAELYENLAAESDEVRLDSAKQLIIKFSPENAPSAHEVEKALHRLIRGLCSQRKAARVGFCITLTELLRQLFGQGTASFEGFHLDVNGVLEMVEKKTKVEGNVPGQERRDHLIGRLFGFKAIMQSSILTQPELALKCWNKVLDQIYGMARDVPWLREECGLIIVETIKSSYSEPDFQTCAQELIQRFVSNQLVNTPEGIAIWLTLQEHYESVLPEDVWHKKDPLAKKERTRLARILKEDFRSATENGKDENVKSAAANPNPIFAWGIVLAEILQRDERLKDDAKDSVKPEFPQFWIDTVDSNLFASSASHERKSWGFKLFASLIADVPKRAIPSLFSPNLMRTLINQSRKEDRFLHAAAVAALKAILLRVEHKPSSALPIFVSLTTKHGTIDLDKLTKTKTLEKILLAADDDALRKMVRHLNSLVLRPESRDQAVADSRRQTIADILLSTVKNYARYAKLSSSSNEDDNWLGKTLELMVENAYFVPGHTAKTSKVPLPPLSDSNRKMFQERLSSCLTRLMSIKTETRTSFALLVIGMIRSKATSSKTLEIVFKADDSVTNTVENAFKTLDTISAKGTASGKNPAAEGFILLYCLTLLQVYDGDGDAVMMLDDIDYSRKAMLKSKQPSTTQGQDAFIEIILSFLGNPRTLFRKIAEDAFTIFISDITSDGLSSLTDILDTDESLAGQRELFHQGGDEEEGVETDDESGEDSDVEMIHESDSTEKESSSGSDDEVDDDEADDDDDNDDDDDDEEDDELTNFNNLLALTLQTSKPALNGEDADESSDDSDMDDEQMMALDPHLTKIFQQRSQVTSKKKDRESAKQTVVQFKSRVLDLLSVYMEKEYSNQLTLNVILPVLRRIRASANKQVADKSFKLLKTYFDARAHHKAPLPKPDEPENVWEILKSIHEEVKMGGGSHLHATACSSASLHVAKVLIGLDRSNYAGVVDVYSETQKLWFMDKKTGIQPALFTNFQNWSVSIHKQGKQVNM